MTSAVPRPFCCIILHREGPEAIGPGTQSDALLHASRQSVIERYVGSFRHNSKPGLHPNIAPAGRRNALRLIDGWIEDYNELHPHSALKISFPSAVHQG